jgi:hypothetical protein
MLFVRGIAEQIWVVRMHHEVRKKALKRQSGWPLEISMLQKIKPDYFGRIEQ